MGHWTPITLGLFICLLRFNYGCRLEGVIDAPFTITDSILDTHRGTIFDLTTTDITGIVNIQYGSGLNSGPYLQASHSGSQFLLTTTDLYAQYEEHEILNFLSITVEFRCVGGNSQTRVFWIAVEDTNNNAPVFLPSNEFEFTIATPVPPGFAVTGCLHDITVRDIDLTTLRIDFAIEENPYFEIMYDEALSTTPKEFKALLRTTTLIRTIPEPITLRISATDVDQTNDPPITTYATVRIMSDIDFQFPEEPVFSQAFYLATYTEENTLVHDPISLRQGYDDHVEFSLQGDHVSNFEIVQNGNQISVRVGIPLPPDVILENQILLVVRAERNFTSGGSSTIIIQLPNVIPLEFERAHYNGLIVDNTLQLEQLRLTQGYEGLVTISITSDHSSNFNAEIQDGVITITMSPLNDSVILGNNFIYLHVVASTDHSSASTIVTLEIVKDDVFTPAFDRALYTGTYDPTTNLVMEPIRIVNGFDDTVALALEGDYREYFQIDQMGPNINLRASTLPPEMYSEQHILLTIRATKPRTVGATATIVISLPEGRILDFEELTYRGTLRNNVLTLETIVLSSGYDNTVTFSVSGDHANYFTVSSVQNQVNLNLLTPLPDSVIAENSFITLTLGADGLNAVTASATIVLEIIKEDTSTPLFSRNIYYATYNGQNGIDIENISLIQGYDQSVTFRIEGEHSQYFGISNTGNNVVLSLTSPIPADVIFRDKFLSINILADKELTVGANTAVLIRFPAELTEPVQMRFSQNTYLASIENDQLSVESIVLSVGYESGTQFLLTGDYAEYFQMSNNNDVISVSLRNPLTDLITADNSLLVLEIEARRERAVSVSSTIVIDIVEQIIEIPVFSGTYYRGFFEESTSLLVHDVITLSSGYDDTVTFGLEGEFSSLFTWIQNNNGVILSLPTPIPEEVLENNDQIIISIIANKPNAINGNAAIIIDLHKESTPEQVLQFDRVTYVGTIADNIATVDPIVLSQGFASNVVFTLHGELMSFFRLTSVGNTVTIQLANAIPETSIPENGVIVLELQASAPGAITAHTTVVFTVVTQEELVPIVELVFGESHYTGSYTDLGGLVFTTPISLSQGYDDTVQFAMEGDEAQWFGLARSQNSVTVTLTSAIPASVVANNHHLIFSVTAHRPGGTTARTTVVIALADEYTEEMNMLGFERVTYVGTIANDIATVDPIVLSQGFASNVVFTLHGELMSFFRLTSVGNTVTIQLANAIPETSIPENGVIVLELQASAPGAITAHTTVVFTVVTQEELVPIVELVFGESHYTGSYTDLGGLVFTTPISLSQGYDDTVQFAMEGDDAQWFGLVRSQNSVTVTLTSAIPASVVANNHHLIFSVTAHRPGGTTARTTVVIALADEYTEEMNMLGFERVTYVGTIANDIATVDPIVLSQGFASNVVFTLHGELMSFFRLTSVGNTVTIQLANAIPETSIPENGVIVLELQASAPGAITAHTTVVLTVVTQEELVPIVELVFGESHYTGSYTDLGGLVFTTPISLSQGYDDTVQFALEGDDAQWFGLVRSQNSVTVTLTSAIPASVVANNHHLIFSVTAHRPGGTTARTTVVIALADEYTEEMNMLGFERVTYVGTIANDIATVDPIVLSQGFASNVVFTLHGELMSFFRLTSVGNTVTIQLANAIPETSIPENGVIVLELQASAPGAITAHTTVVFTVVTQEELVPIVELVFGESHYTGSYSDLGGLVFTTPISLSQGYDDTVQFALEGDEAQWFGLARSQNSVTVTLTSAIPASVVANNHHLIFSVTAHRPGGTTARTTVVIALADEYTEEMNMLGFERVTYVGTIANDIATVDPIVLSQGFASNVVFTLHGELMSFFRLTSVGNTVTIQLANAIPETSIPENGVIVLELQASAPDAITAHTTVVFTVVTQEELVPIVELVFSESHYTGSYTELGGLVFTTPISLSQGYDDTVQFALEGDDAQWFGLVRSQNSVTVTLTSAIPASVVANNHHLIFSVTAHRPGGTTARTTVVIALADEYTEEMNMLGFERVTYVGTIANDIATVDPIVLSQGFASNVVFTLHGELMSFFRLTSVGNTVTIQLANAIPETSIPENGVIVLELQASAPGAITAHTTVVFTVVTQEELVPIVELVFGESHYTGSYSDLGGLVFTTPISLSQGYDDTVQFALEGDDAQWFGLVRSQNSVTVTLTSAIPASVVANNHHLIFSVTAHRPGGTTARTTVVIALADEYTEEMNMLGFERVTYVGTIANDIATVDPIVLSQGFASNVVFTLHGELMSFFRLTSVGNTVTIQLANAIPETSIPENGVIVLELQASAPGAITAHTTVVFTVVTQEELVPIVELVFGESHYTGSYSDLGGLVFTTPISLSQGYDDTVQFALEGDEAQWFGLARSQNSVTVTLTSAIPASVVANNHHLIFSVTAHRPGGTTARTTVVIALADEYTEEMNMLGFERVTYVGTIANDIATVDPIVLSQGFASNVVFTLHGELMSFFRLTSVGNTVTIQLANAIPETSIPENGVIVLELQASAPGAITAHTTVVFTVVTQEELVPIVELVFGESHYTGSYSDLGGLVFTTPISLSQGYDDTVQFALEGDDAQWFGLVRSQNSVTVTLTSAIPASVVANNHHLIFSVTAHRPGGTTARTTVVIALADEYTEEMNMLGFERVTYVGTIANDIATVDPIVLSQGFASNVVFTLHGELMSFFRLTSVGNTVTIQLANAIPETSIPENGVIVLELQASAPGAITAHTTVVLTVVTQEELVPIVELVFGESHYTGSYTDLGGLVFTTPISLSQGYDDTVQFALEGDDAQWFGLVRSQNSVTVTLTSAIPASVVANNHHLIFSVTAHRPGGTTARTTVVIALADEYTEEMNMLGFERVTYVGTIANDIATVDPIVLSQGFASNVVFTLHGELMSFFRLTSVGNTVTIQLANAIPETSIPENGVIVLELQASAPGAITAHTTVVLTVVTQEELVPIVELVFGESHYTGSYTDLGGLVFTTPISLSQGYDDTVQFALEGDDAQWFGLVRSQNSVTVTLTSAIPASVVANNHHLIFSVTAHRPGGTTARTTVVIALADEYTEEMNMLGFERVTYVGTIANDIATVDPIVLSQGFASNVVFTLHGELMSFFRLTSVDNTVTIQLANAIPETSIPENGVIVLELQASAPGAITAHTTVVLTVVTQEELVPIVELVFGESHYTGSYSDLGGLVFTTPISLSQGYDDTVQFAMEGDEAQWFGLARSQNSVTVTLTSAIPASVVANNHHLIFSVTAHRPGGTTARTTVVIALADEYTEEMNMLGFERVTYVGTIANDIATVDPIVLSQGFASNVVFTLHGELMSFFRLTSVGNTVTIQLANAIPETSIPENGVIVLELQASAPGAITAHTTVVFTVVTQEELVPIVELVFGESHYTGSYTDLGGLVFTTPISLSQGYDDTVQFAMEGDEAQWFGLARSQNSVTVTLTSAIPASVVANNHHLIFSVTAHRPGGTTARTTVVIALADEYTEEMNMLGFERVTYVGTIANDIATVDPIVLSQGFASNVVFTLHGELMSFFRLTSVGNTVTIQLANAIPETSIPENGVIVLELQASAPGAITAHTTVVFTVVTQEELVPIVELVFGESHYTGSYTDLGGLVFTTPISLSQGYDDTVQFALEGDEAQWFGLVRSQNSVTVTLTSAIPASVVANNHHLIFSVTAHRPGGTTARTTVVIALADEYTEEMNMLGFERVTYVGTIANDIATVDPIVLSQGFASNVVFTLHGELMSFFRLTSVGNTVTIQLANAIPETSIPENGVIVLELQASAPDAITAHTTVVFTVVTQEELVPIVELVFSESHYTGSYTDLGGLVFTTPISLSQGYDDTVQFALEGDDAQWFGLVRSQNSVTVTLTSAIPASVVANNHHLIFSVTAHRPGGTTARTTVVIALADEYTEEMNMLGFERVTYVGTIANDIATVDPIVLSQGFASNVVFTLHGELMSFFRLTSVGNTVTIQLANAIPETSIPENGVIVLELQASAPGAITAHTTVVFTVVTQEELVPIVELVFGESHYTGSYTDLGGLVFTTPISLSQGYDDTVQFALEGDDAQWFGLVRSQNSVTVTLTSAIPASVVANNHHLIFSVTAHRPGGTTARTTVVIALADEYTEEMNMLGFERVTYVGTIANDIATVDPIVLSQGFASNVVFTLHGELMSFFRLTSVGNTVTIQLANAIPETSIPENGVIVLELQASAPDAITAHTTVVFTVVTQEELVPIVELVFSESHYTGSYTDLGGLVFTTPISLSQGYDDTVQFALEGDDAQWFGLVRSQNSVTVTLTSAIPASVVANNHHLIFSVTAHRPGGTTARTTVVIALADEYTEEMNMLGFERVTYVGTIANDIATVDPIVLSQGFASNVVFTLHGELMSFFRLTSVGNTVTIQLANAIPETSIPENGVIVLELQASAPGAITAHTTVVLTVVTQEELVPIVELVFGESHYTGSYTDLGGLVFTTPISLSQGYDDTVQFALEGDDAQWFGLVRSQNSVTVTLTSAIPASVVANNHHLIFSVTAHRPGGTTARTTVVIALADEYTEEMNMLGFERVTYVGTIANDIATVDPIVLSQGFASNVVFTLHGELMSFFRLTSVGNTVTIQLANAIPETSIPENGVIVLELQASAPGAITAHTTVVLTVVTQEELVPIVELVFGESHYTGSYTDLGGLVFTTPISLSQGYDDTVQFALEGDDAQWFGLVRSQNSVTVTLTSAIPASVVANNHHLIFSVTAHRPGGTTARTTVVIALADEYTEEMNMLGFERVTYVGTIANDIATVDPIVLSQGFASNVVFTLHGELMSFFRLTSVDNTVTIQLANAIPETSIPENGVIVLELQASAPGAITAHTTVVLTVVTQEELVPIVELVFGESHYTGSYSDLGGLVFTTPISLSQGYDDTVQFALEGDDAQWFGLARSQNSVTVTLTSAIPASVVANNHHLIFSVTAHRPGGTTARTTVVIALADEYTEEMNMLGFERVTYVGTIANDIATVDPIVLSQGFASNVVFTLHGELMSFFRLTSVGNTVTIQLANAIPETSIPENGVIVLELQASAPGAITAHTTVVFTVVTQEELVPIVELVFGESHYTGSYSDLGGLVFTTPISLSQGYDDTVQFALEGDEAQWFGLARSQNSVTVTLTSAIPASVVANNHHLIFSVTAHRPGGTTARTTVVIALADEYTEEMNMLGFERVTYVGTIANDIATVDPIVLSQGFASNVVFTLHGELMSFFRLTSVGNTVTIQLANAIPETSIPENGVIVLELQASAPGAITAHTTVVFTVVTQEELVPIVELVFGESHYTGSYTDLGGLVFTTPISLSQGYDDTVQFALEGDEAQWFGLARSQNSVTVTLTSAIPASVVANNHHLIFSVTAHRPGGTTARATIIISLNYDTETELGVSFDKVLYEGILHDGVVRHENIILVEYSGADIEIHGEFSGMFFAHLTGNQVVVQMAVWAASPDVSHVALELHASPARAVLLLTVIPSDVPIVPVVTFSSPTYSLSIDDSQTGLIGRVVATADNGESVRYTITPDENLRDRLSINENGEIYLSAPTENGNYSSVVIATTIFTQVRAQATVYLTVGARENCGEGNLPALIIIDRDEETPHQNLVVLDLSEHPGCRYILGNRWPEDQPWLYVDEAGLHTSAIDREHESIAFMALSQVKVELTLHCENDNERSKRSLDARPDLGPYDYGNNEWVLSSSIPYNPRRTVVNLIVNDINDNHPLFVGKENEPIAVGYPIDELAEMIMPRSLVELHATDADVGINAALLYWSTEDVISVAPTTGFVHVRDGARIENDTRLIIHATDRNGVGLSGSIEILVKLLNTENIVVLTIRNAFLNDERNILTELSNALGYDVKVLRSTVMPDGAQANQDDSSRKRRNAQATGSSLQLCVYGMIEREPVTVERLTADINNNAIVAVTVASVVSLQDYLEGREICVIPGRDTGLLVATILLSILLFILIVLIAVWFMLKRRKKVNYDEFSDENSLASRNEPIGPQPKPVHVPKPRLNIDELKKSERRLQEMLHAPVHEAIPTTSSNELPLESVIDIPPPDSPAPIVTVIQSIDKLKDATDESDTDEFGEVDTARRKSVVTFNENVEKIIHVEDNEDLSTHPGYEIYKL